jgi:hypothetical protein
MMATVSVRHGELLIEVEEIDDEHWALRCQLEIPLSQVAGAILTRLDADHHWVTGLGPTSPFHALQAASLIHIDGFLVWGVVDPAKAVTIRLAAESYPDVIIEVEDPEAVVDRITEAVAANRP